MGWGGGKGEGGNLPACFAAWRLKQVDRIQFMTRILKVFEHLLSENTFSRRTHSMRIYFIGAPRAWFFTTFCSVRERERATVQQTETFLKRTRGGGSECAMKEGAC